MGAAAGAALSRRTLLNSMPPPPSRGVPFGDHLGAMSRTMWPNRPSTQWWAILSHTLQIPVLGIVREPSIWSFITSALSPKKTSQIGMHSAKNTTRESGASPAVVFGVDSAGRSVYDSWRYFGNGLMYAMEPWSGSLGSIANRHCELIVNSYSSAAALGFACREGILAFRAKENQAENMML